jgi:hypothetical protein
MLILEIVREDDVGNERFAACRDWWEEHQGNSHLSHVVSRDRMRLAVHPGVLSFRQNETSKGRRIAIEARS